MVNDLVALQRGGRISGSVAAAGSKLDIKPIVAFDAEGRLNLAGIARGRKKAMASLVKFYDAHANKDSDYTYVIVGNADCPKDAEKTCAMLRKIDENLVIINGSIGPVIGSHTGAGLIGVMFWGSDMREDLSVADRIANKIKKS